MGRHELVGPTLSPKDAAERAVLFEHNARVATIGQPFTHNEAVVHHGGVNGGVDDFRFARQVAANEQGDVLHVETIVVVQVAVNDLCLDHCGQHDGCKKQRESF